MLDNIDKYVTDNLSRLQSPKQFTKEICVAYPSGNKPIFEEWVIDNYVGCDTDRVLIDIPFTSYWVNNNYANDLIAKQEIQAYIDTLPTDKKYFVICQYDDGVVVDWKGKDVLEFNMSKTRGIMIPLISQPQPFKFKGGKKWLANFVGSKTHPIRESAEKLKSNDSFYISYEPHSIENYCRIIHESIFTLCYRGYGANSFRTIESLQYGSIPVYISDEFIKPFDIDFEKFGLLIHISQVDNVAEILESIEPEKIIELQDNLQEVYEKYYTYQGCFNEIIKALETEYNLRK